MRSDEARSRGQVCASSLTTPRAEATGVITVPDMRSCQVRASLSTQAHINPSMSAERDTSTPKARQSDSRSVGGSPSRLRISHSIQSIPGVADAIAVNAAKYEKMRMTATNPRIERLNGAGDSRPHQNQNIVPNK